ncbi:serine hydrolase domain-containing protein [Cellulomonas sp. FA1]|uniref:serine hydrolase domain-containing protein n=1 Tax=Cellulomonas sp. FA1 TaxID=1346710 RepID=UPI000625CE97|nr:serine hydrolase domain-containing protein [Cellulomonas sp. FA1]
MPVTPPGPRTDRALPHPPHAPAAPETPHATTRRRLARRVAPALALVAGLGLLTACGAAPEVPEPRTPQPASTAGLTTADVDAWLDATVPDALAEGRIAGATVAVVHDGEVVTARGFGEADVAAGTPVDPDRTLFRPGSVSKMVTATAVMQLVEDGRVDLDTDVEQYTGLDLGYERPVTLRDLLTHTGGFEERLTGLIGGEGTVPDLRASLVTDPPQQVYAPGTTPAYSNYGNALAGYVVEAVSGQPFEDYVAEHVLAPAGMTSSTFAQPLPADLADRVSQGYATSDDAPVGFEVVGQPPAGGLSAPATDMARFMLAHLGHPTTGEPLLSDATRALMQEPALGADTLGALAEGERMGLGWFDESRHGHRVVGHGGDTTAFHSHLQLWPDDDTGLYLSLNSTGAGGAAYQVREDLLAGFADRYFPADEAPAASTVDDATRAAHAQALAGRYEPGRAFVSTFLTATGVLQPTAAQVVDGDRVLFTPGPGQLTPAVYEEVEPWVFRQVDSDRRLAVRLDDAGRVQVIGHDSAMTLLPLTPARAAVVPVLAVGALVLLLTVLAWPVGAVVRRVRRRRAARPSAVPAGSVTATGAVPATTSGAQPVGASATPPVGASATPPTDVRRARLTTRLAALATLVALAGWVLVVLTLVGLQPVPDAVLRVLQALTALGVLGVLAAAWRVVAEARARTGWWRTVTATVVLAALVGTSWAALQVHLLSPDLTY